MTGHHVHTVKNKFDKFRLDSFLSQSFLILLFSGAVHIYVCPSTGGGGGDILFLVRSSVCFHVNVITFEEFGILPSNLNHVLIT